MNGIKTSTSKRCKSWCLEEDSPEEEEEQQEDILEGINHED